MTLRAFLAVVFVFVFLLTPFLSLAEIPQSSLGPQLDQTSNVGRNGFGLTEMVRTIARLVNWFAWFIAVAAVAIGLYSGFLYITARGNPQQVAIASKTILYAIIGIAVAVLSFSIVIITKTFLNIS